MLLIMVNNGDIFFGTLNHWRDCFFDNASRETIQEWCDSQGWKVEFRELTHAQEQFWNVAVTADEVYKQMNVEPIKGQIGVNKCACCIMGLFCKLRHITPIEAHDLLGGEFYYGVERGFDGGIMRLSYDKFAWLIGDVAARKSGVYEQHA